MEEGAVDADLQDVLPNDFILPEDNSGENISVVYYIYIYVYIFVCHQSQLASNIFKLFCPYHIPMSPNVPNVPVLHTIVPCQILQK